MTTYTTITNAEIDQDSPITQPLLTALRDNPVAITEGSAGAPKVQAAALDTFIARVNAGSPTITNLDTQASIMCAGGVTNGTLTVELSDDNGSTWATAETIVNLTTSGDESATLNISINFFTGAYAASGAGGERTGTFGGGDLVVNFNIYGGTGTITTPTGTVNAIRFGGTGSFGLNVYGG